MLISPSILAADFANLEKDCKDVLSNGADMLHIDVMDGVFVKNISIGVPVLNSLSKKLKAFYDVHLMIVRPHLYIEQFVKAGADLISFHVESESDTKKTIDLIHSFGIKAGLVVKPDTDIQSIYEYLDDIELVLIMSVEPGFGGQEFMPKSLDKIKALKQEKEKRGLKDLLIEVDGGINEKTALLAKVSGADVLVAGSYIFKSENRKKAIDSLR